MLERPTSRVPLLVLRHARRASLSILLLLPSLEVSSAPLPLSERGEVQVVSDRIVDETTWLGYSKEISGDRIGKFVIDLSSGRLYFFDVNVYPMHIDFVFRHLMKRVRTAEDVDAFRMNYEADKDRFILGYLTHHRKVNKWTFSFWENDEIRPDAIRLVARRLKGPFFHGNELSWRPDSPEQESLISRLGDLPIITNDVLYRAAPYQVFTKGHAVGRLRIVSPDVAPESVIFNRDEIVVLQESFPDITPVAGIISTKFSSPLSHLNLRAKSWQIPYVGWKDAMSKVREYDGRWVSLHAESRSCTVRLATEKEVNEARARVNPSRSMLVPRADLTVSELRPLDKMKFSDVTAYGAKAANLGALKARVSWVRIPPGFGIPFLYYRAHLMASGADSLIESLLRDPRFASDAAWRREALRPITDRIISERLDPTVLRNVARRVNDLLGGKGVFVRSSTNAEDLEGFSGAGLYETVPNVTGDEALERAIKRIWASVWSPKAVEARIAAGIDHRTVYGGVLIQIGMKATAAGVLVTKNLFDPEDRSGYTISATRGLGLRVVNGTTVPEQVIFDISNYGTRIISRSDEPNMLVLDEEKGGVKKVATSSGAPILTRMRALKLADVVLRFTSSIPWSRRHPLDVEWLFVGDEVWIVQVRPYVGH